MPESPELKRIGRYEITRILGEGAMGVVYEGIDPRLHRKVAIKRILRSALDGDTAAEYSMRFKREAQAVARLNHPNIVQVFDFAEEADVAYIVMEFVQGRELKTFFDAAERFELNEIVHIMGELCDALHFAHEAGIVHRDIKPANVMIDAQGRVKLTDFGVARITADSERTLAEQTQAGTVLGTPSYMSPEQINGGTLDRRSDIFSAGVILYEFLCGTKPFIGSGTWGTVKKILQEEPPAPSGINSTLSPLFDRVVARALSKTVEGRYQTARDFGMALKRALEGLPEVDEAERTVRMQALSKTPAAALQGDATELRTVPAFAPATKSGVGEVELEFWRSIKDGNDPADFDLYVQQYPGGIYAALARRKSAKLRGAAVEDTAAREQERKEAEEAAQREADARQKLAQEKADLEARLARREAEMAQREAELKKLAAEAPRKSKSSAVAAVLVTLLVATIGGGIWYWLKPPDPLEQRVAELTQMLQESKKREAELVASRQRESELVKELELARQREAEARQAGDVAKQRELAEQVRQREAAATKQAELTRQREAEARKQAEAAEARRAEIVQMQAAAPAAKAPAAPPPKAVVETPKVVEAPKPAAPEPVVVATAPAQPEATPSADSLLKRAIALEGEGNHAEAARLLRQAARSGKGEATGQAAKRLGDILQKGAPGVPRDYAEALRFYQVARANGVEVTLTKAR